MPSMVPKGAPDSRPLDVPDESVDFWTERGYVQAKSSGTSKTAAKKTAAKKSSSK